MISKHRTQRLWASLGLALISTVQTPGQDWPMWGRSPSRNMVSDVTKVSIDFEPPQTQLKTRRPGKKLVWAAQLGSQTYGQPVIAGGKVFIGTNNHAEYLWKHRGDRGCLLCFDEATGKFIWQLTRPKLENGRVNDWPMQGIVSVPCVQKDRLWVLTNRAELVCVDTEGFHDGENDGPFQEESDEGGNNADIVWNLDLIEEFGVFPHNLATSAPVVHDDLIFVISGNGVNEAHTEVVSPRSPSFLAVDKNTGKLVWKDNSPFDKILHGQWSCPSIGMVNGRAQVYMAGGDGWLYAFEPKTGKTIWRFDLNPKESKWDGSGRGDRNSIIATPVFFANSVILAVGQDPEHGEGVGHMYRIDATKTGDVSAQTPDGRPNPNSAQIWHYGGIDQDGSVSGEKGKLIFRRTLSTVAIADDLVFAADLSGYLHCLDLATGKRHWEHDLISAIWGSPLVVDGRVFLGDEDGELLILNASNEKQVLAKKEFPSSIYSTPAVANDRIFIVDRSSLYVFDAR